MRGTFRTNWPIRDCEHKVIECPFVILNCGKNVALTRGWLQNINFYRGSWLCCVGRRQKRPRGRENNRVRVLPNDGPQKNGRNRHKHNEPHNMCQNSSPSYKQWHLEDHQKSGSLSATTIGSTNEPLLPWCKVSWYLRLSTMGKHHDTCILPVSLSSRWFFPVF